MNFIWKLVCECRNDSHDDSLSGAEACQSQRNTNYGSTSDKPVDVTDRFTEVVENDNKQTEVNASDVRKDQNYTKSDCLICSNANSNSEENDEVFVFDIELKSVQPLSEDGETSPSLRTGSVTDETTSTVSSFDKNQCSNLKSSKRAQTAVHQVAARVNKVSSNKRRYSNLSLCSRKTEGQGMQSPGFSDKSTHFQYIITTTVRNSPTHEHYDPTSSPKKTTSYSCPKPKRHVAQVLPGLLIGSQEFAHDLHALEKHGVTHVVNATIELDNCYPQKFCYKKLDIPDQPSTNINEHFEDCYRFIQDARSAGGCVLVHCYYGASRSASIIVAFLIRNGDMRYKEAIDFLQKLRPGICPNDGFVRQLIAYETRLLKS